MFSTELKSLIVLTIILAISVQMISRGQNDAPMIRSWNQMREIWFLKPGEDCDQSLDRQDHFSMFFDLVGTGSSRIGIPEHTAKELAKTRCGKEGEAQRRVFGCNLQGYCDCADGDSIYESTTQECRKFDAKKCRKHEECIPGYFCDTVIVSNATIKRQLIATKTVEDLVDKVDEFKTDELDPALVKFKELQEEHHRRVYVNKLLEEGQRIVKAVHLAYSNWLVDYPQAPFSAKAYPEKFENEANAAALSTELPYITQSVINDLIKTLKACGMYTEATLVQNMESPPNARQIERVKAFELRVMRLTDPKYMYPDRVPPKAYPHKKEKWIDIDTNFNATRKEYFEMKTKFFKLAGKVCHCAGVSKVDDCITQKTNQRPQFNPDLFNYEDEASTKPSKASRLDFPPSFKIIILAIFNNFYFIWM